MTTRDRDAAGRARNSRPRDGLGRPLPHGSEGVERVPDDLVLPPGESLAEAQRLLDACRPFHAHEVLEGTWKAAPAGERDLWQGLAQLAVGVTHRGRGNAVGAARLLRRGAGRIEAYAERPPYGLDVAGIVRTARGLADDPADSTPLRLLPPAPGALRLRPLEPGDEQVVLAAHEALTTEGFEFAMAWRPGMTWPEFLRFHEDYRRGRNLLADHVPSTFLVAEVDGVVVGRLSVRHALNEWLATYGGHIGYGVLAEHRRRGHATAMLREGLVRARLLGIDRVLVTCDDDNVASARVIEACGGRPDPDLPLTDGDPPKRRYWID